MSSGEPKLGKRRGGLKSVLASTIIAFAALLSGAEMGQAAEFSVHAGRYNTEHSYVDGPVVVGFEVRLDTIELWHPSWGELIPAFGVLGTASEEVYYLYSGFRLQVPLGCRWRLTPHLAAGWYDEGAGQDLGGSVEFRSGLELAYRIKQKVLVGLDFYHLSNAVLYDFNPGANSIVLSLSFGL